MWPSIRQCIVKICVDNEVAIIRLRVDKYNLFIYLLIYLFIIYDLFI